MDNTREKIVIIEADPLTLETLRSALDAAGYDVAGFRSSVEALDAIHGTGANLLLMNALGRSASGAGGPHPRETIDFHYERKLYKVMAAMLVDPNAPPPATTVLQA